MRLREGEHSHEWHREFYRGSKQSILGKKNAGNFSDVKVRDSPQFPLK